MGDQCHRDEAHAPSAGDDAGVLRGTWTDLPSDKTGGGIKASRDCGDVHHHQKGTECGLRQELKENDIRYYESNVIRENKLKDIGWIEEWIRS